MSAAPADRVIGPFIRIEASLASRNVRSSMRGRPSRALARRRGQGTTRTVVRGCTFVGQSRAAIGDYKGIDNRYYRNDFSGIAPNAVHVSYQHGAQ